MHIFFFALSALIFGLSLYLSNWIASIACSLILLILIWTRFFSRRILKNYFKKASLLKSSPFHYLESELDKAFSEAPYLNTSFYVTNEEDEIQAYIFGYKKNCNLVFSEACLRHLRKEDLIQIAHHAKKSYTKKTYTYTQPLVAAFLFLTSFGRLLDSILSFALGLKTDKGEPRPITRKFFYFLLGQFSSSPHIIKNETNLNSIPTFYYSYAFGKKENPVLKPLSLIRKTI